MRVSPEMKKRILALAGESPTKAARQPYVTLPIPPSANNLFVNAKRGRVRSKAYREWSASVAATVRGLSPPVELPCRFCLVVLGDVNQQRDLDNCVKPCLDACVAEAVIPGDSLKYVRSVNVVYMPDVREPRVMLWFEGMGELEAA